MRESNCRDKSPFKGATTGSLWRLFSSGIERGSLPGQTLES
jgi:hypothetical protein